MSENRENGTPAYKRIQGSILKNALNRTVENRGRSRFRARVGEDPSREPDDGAARAGCAPTRRHGGEAAWAGTFVAPPKIHFNKLASLVSRWPLAVAGALESPVLQRYGTEQELRRDVVAASSRLIKVER